MLARLPWHLIYLRLFLAPFAVIFGYYHILGAPYILLLSVAAITDIYDGVLARKLKVETAALRQWDTVVDTIFFLGVLAGMFIAYPGIYAQYQYGIYAILGIEAIRYIVDLLKFGRGASYHAYSAKTFGVSLLVATIAIMGFGVASPFLPLALAIGVLSELEGLCMSLVLPQWGYNIKHIVAALKIRNNNNDHAGT